ncbi:Histone-lysine N-methyltransferase, H3 lysine-9 specific SUVH6 [Linum perenne]
MVESVLTIAVEHFSNRKIASMSVVLCAAVHLLATKNEANQRTNDVYLFGIGRDWDNGEGDSTAVQESKFAIDAAKLGNIGRFFNHSCSQICMPKMCSMIMQKSQPIKIKEEENIDPVAISKRESILLSSRFGSFNPVVVSNDGKNMEKTQIQPPIHLDARRSPSSAIASTSRHPHMDGGAGAEPAVTNQRSLRGKESVTTSCNRKTMIGQIYKKKMKK